MVPCGSTFSSKAVLTDVKKDVTFGAYTYSSFAVWLPDSLIKIAFGSVAACTLAAPSIGPAFPKFAGTLGLVLVVLCRCLSVLSAA